MKNLLPVSLIAFLAICIAVSCSKEKSYETGSGGTPATGSVVKDSQNQCSSIALHGTYYSGITLHGDTNYVEVQVNITKIGSYKISTDSQNNMIFSDSGYFAATGVQTIKLKGSGKPILASIVDFTVSFDSSYCSFQVNVLDGTGISNPDTSVNGSDTAWHFSDGSTTYHGFIDSLKIRATQGTSNGVDTTFTALFLTGYGSTSTDTAFQLAVVMPGNVVVPGTYTKSDGTLLVLAYTGGTTASNIYTIDSNSSSTDMTVVIESYDATTKIVTGHFSGTAQYQSSGTLKSISGRFTGKLTS